MSAATSRTVVALAALVVVVAGLRLAAPFLVPMVFAATVVAVTSPVAAWVTRRGLPPIIGALAAILVGLCVLGAIGSVFAVAGAELQTRAPVYANKLQAIVARWAQSMARHGFAGPGRELGRLDFGDATPYLGMILGDAAAAVSSSFVIGLVAFFGLTEISSIGAKVRALYPGSERTLERVDGVVSEVQRYLLVKAGTSLLAATLTFVLLRVAGVEMALLLALVLFVLHFIPNVGAVLATIPAVAVAAVDHGPGVALIVGVGISAINFIVGNVVEPRVLGRTLGLSPLAVLVGLVFWGWLWGPAGALLAVPILVVTKAVLENVPDLQWAAAFLTPPPVERDTKGRPSLALLHQARAPIGLGAGRTPTPPPVTGPEP
jgi:predicted PurR-regulated permease PerM